MRNIIAVILAIAFCRPCYAEKVSVFFGHKCETYNEALAEPKEVTSASAIVDTFDAYVAGYLSAVAVENGDDFIMKTNFNVIKSEISDQCKLFPEASISDIAIKISRRMRGS